MGLQRQRSIFEQTRLQAEVKLSSCTAPRWVVPVRRQESLPSKSAIQLELNPCNLLKRLHLDPTRIPQTRRRGLTGVQNVKNLTSKLSAGKPVDPPYVGIDVDSCKFSELNGKHRMVAACRLGMEKIPLEILFSHGKARDTKDYFIPADREAKHLFNKCLK